MNIIKSDTPNKSSRQGFVPELIVCHITEGSYKGAISWLRNPASGASANFVVSRKGEITQLVPIEEKAWCNGKIKNPTNETVKGYVAKGNLDGNLYTVSIEHEGVWLQTKGELTAEQEKATTELIGFIVKEVKRIWNYDIPIDHKHIIGHRDIDMVNKRHCPGDLFPFDRIIANLTATGGKKPVIFPGASFFGIFKTNDYIYILDLMLIKAGYGSYLSKGATKSWGQADKNAVMAFQKAQGWTGSGADGYPGKMTWAKLQDIYLK